MVINYDVPNDGEDYIHRIGRTARAETDGVAYTFISEKEQNKFRGIEELLGSPVNKTAVPEQFGPAPEYSPRTRSKSRHRRPGGGQSHGGGQRHGGSGDGQQHRGPQRSDGNQQRRDGQKGHGGHHHHQRKPKPSGEGSGAGNAEAAGI